MVKPQFEVGRDRVGKNGVVREREERQRAVGAVAEAAVAVGWGILAAAPAGLPGPKGNRETFLHLCEGQRAGASVTLEGVVLEAIA